MHDDWCGFGTPKVVPTEVSSVLGKPSGRKRDGVLEYAEEGGEVAAMFESFCARNLCGESWDFIVAARKYEVHKNYVPITSVRRKGA